MSKSGWLTISDLTSPISLGGGKALDQIKKLRKKYVFLLVIWGLVFVYFILTSSIDEKLRIAATAVAAAIIGFSAGIIMIFTFSILSRKKHQ